MTTLLMTTLLMTTGCSPLRLADLESHALPPSPSAAGQPALLATLPSPLTCRAHLGLDPITSGVLPVLLRATNHAHDASFVLRPEQIRASLSAGSGVSAPSARTNIVAPSSGLNPVLGGVLIFLALVPAIIANVVANNALSNGDFRNWAFVTNRLESATLSPGESVSGLVYFDHKGGERPKQLGLDVEVLDLATRTTRHIHVEVTPEVQ